MFEHILAVGPLGVIAAALSFYVSIVLIQPLIDPLRRVPGPFLARFTRLWLLYKYYQGEFEIVNIELHRKYGPVVRIAPNEYSVDSVDAAKLIYGHGNNFVKAMWYYAWSPLDPAMASLFADRNPHHHGIQRRKVASAYSMSSMVGYEPFVNNCTRLFADRMRETSHGNKTIDFAHWFQCYAFDVIGEVTFGNRFGLLDTGIDKDGIFSAIDSRASYATFVGVLPWLHKFFSPLLPKGGGFAYLVKFTEDQIHSSSQMPLEEKTDNRDGALDFVAKFLMARKKNPEKMESRDILMTCLSNISAGSDTTAITLSSILYHLLKHPRTYKLLQKEVDEGIASGTISDPITFKEATQLPYLQAVIKEALRLHSATGLPLARVVPASGTSFADYDFPAGATVGINSWVAHHNTSVYGADADEWRPERWLEVERDGRGGEVERYFFPFGMGSRTCIGKNLSLLEVSKLIPELLRNFDFVLDEELQHSRWTTLNKWFVKPQNFRGKVTLRNV